ncbi:MAG: PqqD family protein [Clostridia bacterium]|nr:PqqD family protein [Clostridia bacterium]
MIRVNEGYKLKQIIDEYVIVATGDKAVKFSAVLVLNEVGAIVFKLLQEGKTETEIEQALMAEFSIDEATASADVERFINKLIGDGVCARV